METWKDILSYEGYYQVSSLGRVRGVDRMVPSKGGSFRMAKGKILKQSIQIGGYKQVWLQNGGAKKSLVHRLVLETFVGLCPPGMECCHNDGNPWNNNVSNLRWDTFSSNMEDKRKHGKTRIGSSHQNTELREEDVLRIRKMQRKPIEIARLFGISRNAVYKILHRRSWCHI